MKPLQFTAALMAFAGLCLSGCGRHFESLPENPRVASVNSGESGGRLVLAMPGFPQTFNPLLAMDGGSDAVVRLLFRTLVELDMTTLEAGPGLAESWSVAEDQKTWTFKLRKGLRWSDGEPLTADDVVFTWNQVMYNPEFNRVTFDLFQLNGRKFEVIKMDDVTVKVVTPEVFAPFVDYFGSVVVLPRHVFEPHVSSNQFTNAYSIQTRPDKLVGSGPFRVKDYRPGHDVLLQHNPYFWVTDGSGERLPYLDEILLTNATQVGAANLFLQDDVDVCENVRPEEWAVFAQAQTKRPARLENLGAGADRDFLWFNQNTGGNALGQRYVPPAKLQWFRDKKFRQAISCAINRERIALQIYGGRAEPVHSFISSENPRWHNTNVVAYSYNPDRARALLAEIGIQDRDQNGMLEDAAGNGIEITMLASIENPLRPQTAALIQEDLRQIGILLRFQPVDFRTLLQKVNRTFDYECAMMGLGGGGIDPFTQMNVLKSSAPLHQWFPLQTSPSTEWEARIDALMDAQSQTVDFAERRRCFDEVQAIWAEEVPMISIVAPFAATAYRQDLGNVRPSAVTAYRTTWNIEELYLKKQ